MNISTFLASLAFVLVIVLYGLWPREAAGHSQGKACSGCHYTTCETIK